MTNEIDNGEIMRDWIKFSILLVLSLIIAYTCMALTLTLDIRSTYMHVDPFFGMYADLAMLLIPLIIPVCMIIWSLTQKKRMMFNVFVTTLTTGAVLSTITLLFVTLPVIENVIDIQDRYNKMSEPLQDSETRISENEMRLKASNINLHMLDVITEMSVNTLDVKRFKTVLQEDCKLSNGIDGTSFFMPYEFDTDNFDDVSTLMQQVAKRLTDSGYDVKYGVDSMSLNHPDIQAYARITAEGKIRFDVETNCITFD